MLRTLSPRALGITLAALLLLGGAGARLTTRAIASDGPCPGVDANALPVSNEQAQSIAQAQIPGTVREIKLECEDGRTIYEVELQPQAGGREMEVEIDATSGVVLKVEED